MLRLTLGLSSVMLSVLLATYGLGMVPNRDGAIVDGRRALSEAVAIHCASVISQPNDVQALQTTLGAVVQRNPDLLSAGLRTADGKLLVAIGDHEGPWAPRGAGAIAGGALRPAVRGHPNAGHGRV